MTAGALPDGTITVLLTDIEGSTQRWDADGDAMAEAVRRHEEILAAAIERHHGGRPLEQGEGDSVVAGFARATDAVAAACDAQVALEGEDWPGGLSLRVRMALHTGEVRVDGNRYAGPVLIRAARLRGLAHGGQVLLSAVTRDLVVDDLPDGASLVDHGWHALRGISRPEHVSELRVPGVDHFFPPLVSTRASNLPAEVTTFVGRHQEMTELVDALATNRVLTLTGTGGCGKTRLAQRLAVTVEREFEGGVWWVDAAPLGRGELLATSTASALGLADDPYRGPVDRIVDLLGDAPALIVVDNCEHLLDDASELVATLTLSCRGLHVVVTSREALNIPGELAWRVPSLPEGDSIELFAERAREVRPNLELGDAVGADVARICQRLDGIPLAIELAAARARMLSVAQIADALDDRFRLLTGGQRTVVQRQRTLAASIDWSHDLLDDLERAVFRRLSIFAGAFGLDAAEAVAAGGDVDSYAVLDVIGRLVDKSLLIVDERSDPTRYRMLESIRQYARDRLLDAGEVDDTHARHLDWYSSWVIGLGPELVAADHARRLDELEAEIENLRVALGWAEVIRDGDRLRAMCAALTFFWMLHGHFREGGAWCDRALGLDDGASDRARTQWGLAYIALYAGDYDKAFELALTGHATAEAAGDLATMARCLDTLATMQVFVDVPAAVATATDSIALARDADDQWCLADALQVLATALLVFDELERAEPYLAEAYEIATTLDNRQLIAWHWVVSGGARLRDARAEDAEALARRGLTIAEEVGDLGIIGHGTFVLSRALAMRGRFSEARDGARADASPPRGARRAAVPDLADHDDGPGAARRGRRGGLARDPARGTAGRGGRRDDGGHPPAGTAVGPPRRGPRRSRPTSWRRSSRIRPSRPSTSPRSSRRSSKPGSGCSPVTSAARSVPSTSTSAAWWSSASGPASSRPSICSRWRPRPTAPTWRRCACSTPSQSSVATPASSGSVSAPSTSRRSSRRSAIDCGPPVGRARLACSTVTN